MRPALSLPWFFASLCLSIPTFFPALHVCNYTTATFNVAPHYLSYSARESSCGLGSRFISFSFFTSSTRFIVLPRLFQSPHLFLSASPSDLRFLSSRDFSYLPNKANFTAIFIFFISEFPCHKLLQKNFN